jgi:methylglutaconyl-CoA hydratase
MTNYKTLSLSQEHSGNVLRIKLNRPEVRNSFNEVLIDELHSVFSGPAKGEAQGFEQTRVVVLEGEGPAFCGGGDLNWMKKSLTLSEQENQRDCQKLSHMFLTMDRCPRPVIGLIHGFAIGGGVGLVSICDHVIAAQDTIFSLSEVKLGLIPACIGPFVIAKIGVSQARSLFISGERFAASKAKEINLVHEVVPLNELMSMGNKVVARVLEGGPIAIEAAKFLIHTLTRDLSREDFQSSLDFASGELASLRVQPEAQEGVLAFLEKRTPTWRK